MRVTLHGGARLQQRGIPPLIVQWLQDFGREVHDGRGGRIYWFDRNARREIEKAAGREPVRRMHEWMNAYVVLDERDRVITVGRRYKRIRH